MTEYTKWTLRIATAKLDTLREEYATTYPEHRLSLNAWALKRLLAEPRAELFVNVKIP